MISLWILQEDVPIPADDGTTTSRLIYRRTFYDADDLSWHLDNEAPYLYNPNPTFVISRLDLETADVQRVTLGAPDEATQPDTQGGEAP